jgi:serine/threonine protein kinase
MLDLLTYMHGKNVVHRDLKLENILVDDNMNLKVADFGFATFKKIHALKSYRGTMTYMAPEIKEGKTYDGVQIDLFSTAVILFIIVQGIFPFKEAKKDEYFYNLILKGDLETYWKKTGGQKLSPEFKDLIIKMFSYDGSKRPTVDEIKNHPWMQVPIDMKQMRENILSNIEEARTASTASSTRQDTTSRGDIMLDLIRQPASESLQLRKFNYMQEHDIDVHPGVIWDDLQAFNFEKCSEKLQLEKVDGKYIKMVLPAEPSEDGAGVDLVIKVKFFEIEKANGENPGRTRVRFVKKSGDMQQWYELYK